jgi:hypothetical protein
MTTHIQYIDAYPGTGKTHWAINKMAQFLIEHIAATKEKREPDLDKYGQLFFYVAPTNTLINEISASLKETIYNKIFNQTNDENKALEFSERAASRIYILTLESLTNKQPISKLLAYAGHEYNEDCKATHEKFKILNGSSKYQFEPHVEPLTDKERDLYITSDILYYPGCVVFITQAAFWSANFSESSTMKTFYNRSSTSIIIDEARSCNCDSTEISLSYDAYKYISSLPSSSTNDLNSYHKADKSIFLKDEIRAKLGTTLSLDQFTKLYSFLKMYESASFFIKYNVKNTRAKTTSQPIKASLVVMQVPYAALIGWKDITLMSAFFKQSQLYAVINCAKNIDQIEYDFNLIDITSSTLDEDRIKLLHKRFQNATLTWIFDNYNNISKRVYNSGVVVRSDEFNAKNTYTEISKNFEILKSKEHAELNASYKVANNAFTSLSHYSSYTQFLHYARYSTVKDFLLNCTNKQLIDNFVHNNPLAIPVPPIEVAIRRAIEYAREWTFANNALFKNNKSKKLFKSQAAQSILINFNKTLGFGFNSYNVYNKLPGKLREQFTPLTTDARGLNQYKQFSIIAVLSAFNLPPDIKAWFDQYCCETLVKDGKKVLHCWYDQYQDIALGQVIQTMMRCSLRDTTLDNKVLIILSTKKIAYNINAIFNKSFNLKDPLELFPKVKGVCSLVHASMPYDKTYDSVREELRAKKAAAQREYTNTSGYLKANLKSNTRELTDEELCYKAYKMKYYDESDLRKRYNSLYANRIYLKNKLNEYSNKNYILSNDDYTKYTQRLENLNEELAEVKKQSSMLLAQVKKDFKKKILEDFDAVYNDVKDYIDKVSKKRQKLAEYFENKLNNASESKATSDAT